MSSGKILFAGLPTGPDVQNLIDTLGMPNEGDHIPYADVEAVLGLTRKSDPHRWASVTGAWKRRVEREANVILKAVMRSYAPPTSPPAPIARRCLPRRPERVTTSRTRGPSSSSPRPRPPGG